MLRQSIRVLVMGCALALTACGGGSDGDSPAAPNTAIIGAAGGTVADSGGAKVEVPAGALAQNVAIAVTPSSAGAPVLPAGVTAVGAMVAFTPHGTQFAKPATITLPFDPALLPAGSTVALYKTDATQTAWAAVAGSRVSGGGVSAEVTGFSFLVPAIAPKMSTAFYRSWGFTEIIEGEGDEWNHVLWANYRDSDGQVLDNYNFGSVQTFVDTQHGDGDAVAGGQVYSSETGRTFWISAQAPNFGLGPHLIGSARGRIGSETAFYQTETYRKVAADARLSYTITAIDLFVFDGSNWGGERCQRQWRQFENGPPVPVGLSMCSWPVIAGAEVYLELDPDPSTRGSAVDSSYVELTGYPYNWTVEVLSESVGHFPASPPILEKTDFTADVDVGNSGQQFARLWLTKPKKRDVDLSAIAVGQVFTVTYSLHAKGVDGRQSESYAASFLRDPRDTAGTTPVTLESSGLERVDAPARPADPPGVISLRRADTHGFESESELGGIAVELVRLGGTSGTVGVSLSASTGGTATAGADFTETTKVVSFADGERSKIVRIPVVWDDIAEPTETVKLELTQVTGGAMLGLAAGWLHIADSPKTTIYTLGGTVNGLTGSGLLLDGPWGTLSPVANGPFTMPGTLVDGLPYTVRVLQQPQNPAQACTVSNGSGVVAGANVTNVRVDCITTIPTAGLDTGFGSGGKVAIARPGGVGEALAVQPDGKILVAASGTGNFSLLRLLPDGSLDAGFGSAGIVTTDFGSNDDAYGLALQADGRIVAVGRVQVGGGYDFGITRYEANGQLDGSFGVGGKVSVDFAGGADYARAVVIQPDGRIVVGGQAGVTGRSSFALLRLLPGGGLDSAFGSGGRVQTVVGAGNALGYDLALAPDGKLVLAGVALLGSSDQFAAARYVADGSPDATFGTSGVALVPVLSQSSARGVQVLADGSVLLAGGSASGARSDITLVKFDAAGSPDGSFGGGTGKVTTNLSGGRDYGFALALQADGRVVVGGYRAATAGDDIAVLRYRADGAVDTTFGSAGALVVDHAGGLDRAQAVELQADGRILVAGQGVNGRSTELVVLRILP